MDWILDSTVVCMIQFDWVLYCYNSFMARMIVDGTQVETKRKKMDTSRNNGYSAIPLLFPWILLYLLSFYFNRFTL